GLLQAVIALAVTVLRTGGSGGHRRGLVHDAEIAQGAVTDERHTALTRIAVGLALAGLGSAGRTAGPAVARRSDRTVLLDKSQAVVLIVPAYQGDGTVARGAALAISGVAGERIRIIGIGGGAVTKREHKPKTETDEPARIFRSSSVHCQT